jgi:hypothetical protein
MPHRLDAWLYKNGRPNKVASILNTISNRLAAGGRAPKQLHSLQVRGRRTGRVISLPVVVADHGERRYLVAMLGERTRWVANVRAANGRAMLVHGRRESVRLIDVDPADRAPVLRRYLDLAPGARAHFPVDRSAPIAAFERVAREYPVFRIEAQTCADAAGSGKERA